MGIPDRLEKIISVITIAGSLSGCGGTNNSVTFPEIGDQVCNQVRGGAFNNCGPVTKVDEKAGLTWIETTNLEGESIQLANYTTDLSPDPNYRK